LHDLNSKIPSSQFCEPIYFDVETIECRTFVQRLSDAPGYLNRFRVLLFGGSDGWDGFKRMTLPIVRSHLAPFWQNGGSILFLHDVLYGNRVPSWGPLAAHLGIRPPYTAFAYGTVAQFVGDAKLRQFPFVLPECVTVAETHTAQRVPKEDVLIAMPGSDDAFYFACKGRIGFTQLGHTAPIEIDEQRLAANMIVHLMTNSL
jgi:hypothetical protein